MNRTTEALARFGGGAGAVAATAAALCCAGAPIIVSVLAATGLSFLRSDAILIPVIGVGSALLLGAMLWNARLPRACEVDLPLAPARR